MLLKIYTRNHNNKNPRLYPCTYFSSSVPGSTVLRTFKAIIRQLLMADFARNRTIYPIIVYWENNPIGHRGLSKIYIGTARRNIKFASFMVSRTTCYALSGGSQKKKIKKRLKI